MYLLICWGVTQATCWLLPEGWGTATYWGVSVCVWAIAGMGLWIGLAFQGFAHATYRPLPGRWRYGSLHVVVARFGDRPESYRWSCSLIDRVVLMQRSSYCRGCVRSGPFVLLDRSDHWGEKLTWLCSMDTSLG